MDETIIVGENVGVVRAGTAAWPVSSWSGLSWSAVIAGALTAIAVTVIIVALGAGIGMSLASPYSYSPSGETLTIIGALWLVFSQAVGFAVGGYVAGRLRRDPASARTTEVQFRDGANGLTVWAIGVVVSMVIIAAGVAKVGSVVGSTAGQAAGLAADAAANQAPSIDYFTDTLLRPAPQGAAAANPSTNPAAANGNAQAGGTNGNQQRAQINRILLTGLGPNGLSTDDRAYLAQIVSAQTGMSQGDAQRRVDNVVNQAKQDATKAADAARKAAAYLSFWTFMSLLFGAVCAALGGILGGDLRDETAVREAVSTSPR